MPRYWVSDDDVQRELVDSHPDSLLVVRRFGPATNERSIISCITPIVAFGDSGIVIISNRQLRVGHMLLNANLTTLLLDYAARQKIGSVMVNQFILTQLPVLPPHTYESDLLAFITPRVLELTYAAWDLQAFAQDVGYDGPPFVWDEDRRFLMRCELDALYFHLYQISRDDADYILDTFPIVKRKDEAAHGEYRTKRVILEMYDQMAALPKVSVPAPKQPPSQTLPPQGEGLSSPPRHEGEGDLGGEGYLVPDVSQYVTWLTPPPADPRVAHPPKQ